MLQGARLCFYLSALPFDWPTLALEALYFGIPTVFPDQNNALLELLPNSPFKLSTFLVERSELSRLKQIAIAAQGRLLSEGIWDGGNLGPQYRALYQSHFS